MGPTAWRWPARRAAGDIGDPRLVPGVIEYSRGLHDAADRRLWWWVIVLLGVVALGTAVVDTKTARVREAPGEAVVSWLYFAFFPIDAWWWPRRQARLLANAQGAEESARRRQEEPDSV